MTINYTHGDGNTHTNNYAYGDGNTHTKVVQFALTIPSHNGNAVITVTGTGKTAEEANLDFEAKRLDMIRALGGRPIGHST